MYLYHIHLLKNKDHLYKKDKIIVVDPKDFNNRLFYRINNANVNVSSFEFMHSVYMINNKYVGVGEPPVIDSINLGDLSNYFGCELVEGNEKKYGFRVDYNELAKFFFTVGKSMLAADFNYREMALEEYRLKNCPDKPSRLHSMFACSEIGLNHWKKCITDGDSDIFEIEVEGEPFVSNDMLLPSSKLPYGEKVIQAARYFKPRQKDLDPLTDEYLVQGRVRIIKKVDEIRQPKHIVHPI